jgi:carboxypeptidase family protein/TonB-dependent receptor-like protein
MFRLERAAVLFLAGCLSLTVFSIPLTSQIRSGAITGVITDPSGAPIQGASVSVVAEETNFSYSTASNSSGEFTIPYLPFGRYTLTVEKAGFQTSRLTGLAVSTAQTVRADVRPEISAVASTVDVTAAAAELQTDSSTVQNTIQEQLIKAVPNITHNPFYYATLQPGLVPRAAMNDTQSVNSFGIGIDGRRTFSAISANGGQAFTNDIQLDGVSVQGSAWNEAAVLPNPEGVQEVRTLINNFTAEYGRAQGVIQVTTKSGSNQFHGSGVYRNRNEFFNANSFGNNARGISRKPFKVNSYAGTIGGPIVPNRAFFFVSYEGLQHGEAVDYLKTVPTGLERGGDFSQTLANVNGTPTPVRIFDPFNVVQTGPNLYQRSPIPNSIIPRPDPFALKLISYYPLPNRTPEDVYNTNNYYNRVTRKFDRNSLNSRLDFRWSNHSLYGTGGFTRGSILSPNSWGPDNPFQSRNDFIGATVTDRNPYGAIGDTIVLSPTLVLDVRYGINRINANNEARIFPDFDYGSFGIPASVQAINAVPGAPLEFSPGNNLSALNQTNSLHKRERQTNHHVVGSLNKSVSKWNFKMGSEYRVYLSNYTDAEESVAIFTSSGYTREIIDAAGGGVGTVMADQAGWGPASFLLGAGNLYVAPGRGTKPALAQKYFAVYSQNDWRATNKMTLNLGLRYELQFAPTERYNRLSSFDFSGKNPYGGPGAFTFMGANGVSRHLWETQHGDFGPRVGLAYRLTNSFVIRAGYGITYLPTNTGYFDGPFVYGQDTFAAFTNSNVYGPSPAGQLAGKYYDVNVIVPPKGADASSPRLYGGGPGPRFDRLDYRNGMSQQWNLFLQKQLTRTWLVSAGYTASKGSHLPFARVPLNLTQYISDATLQSWRSSWIAANGLNNPATEQVPNPLQTPGARLIPFNGTQGNTTITRQDTLIPFPLFGGLQLQRSFGYSNYHALQFQVGRQYANGLQFNAHYTWSKSLDMTQTEAQTNGFADTGGYDIGNLDLRHYRNNYKVSLTDVPHRFLISYVYELPFGAGKRWANQNAGVKAIVGGWRIGDVTTIQSGYPIEISGGGGFTGRPDRIAGAPVEVPKDLQQWYDGKTVVTLPSGRQIRPNAFTFLKYSIDAFQGRTVRMPDGTYQPDLYYYGSAALNYNDIRGPIRNNWNLNLERSFRVREKVSIDFSAQFTNAFNHTQFRPAITGGLGGPNVTASTLNVGIGQLTNSNFGTHGTDTFDPRQTEFQLKIRF